MVCRATTHPRRMRDYRFSKIESRTIDSARGSQRRLISMATAGTAIRTMHALACSDLMLRRGRGRWHTLGNLGIKGGVNTALLWLVAVGHVIAIVRAGQ